MDMSLERSSLNVVVLALLSPVSPVEIGVGMYLPSELLGGGNSVSLALVPTGLSEDDECSPSGMYSRNKSFLHAS